MCGVYYRFKINDVTEFWNERFSKDYFGTIADLEGFVSAYKTDGSNENYGGRFLNAEGNFQRFSEMLEKDGMENREELRCRFTSSAALPARQWEHITKERRTIGMKFDSAEVRQLWLELDGDYKIYFRAMKARVTNLEFDLEGEWKPMKRSLGYPHIIGFNPPFVYNRFAVMDKLFSGEAEMHADYKRFAEAPDTDFREFCNDLFGIF